MGGYSTPWPRTAEELAALQEEQNAQRRRTYGTPEEVGAIDSAEELATQRSRTLRATEQQRRDRANAEQQRAAAGLPPLPAEEPMAPMSPLRPEPPIDYGHFDEEVRNSLAGATRGFIDQRVQTPIPMRPGGPAPATQGEPSSEGRARAIKMPDGRIVLTNQDAPEMVDARGVASKGPSYARSGARDLGARELYQAAKQRLNESVQAPAAGPATSDWRTGTMFEGPATRNMGLRGASGESNAGLPDPGFRASDVQGSEGGGAFTGSGGPLGEGSVADNPDTRTRLSHEDAVRRAQSYSDEAGVEGARQAAAFAKLSPSQQAQLKAAERAPELMGFEAVKRLYAEQGEKHNTLNQVLQVWRQRSQKEGDPLFVEPQNRSLAERMKIEELSKVFGILSESEMKDLISTLAQQRLPQGYPG